MDGGASASAEAAAGTDTPPLQRPDAVQPEPPPLLLDTLPHTILSAVLEAVIAKSSPGGVVALALVRMWALPPGGDTAAAAQRMQLRARSLHQSNNTDTPHQHRTRPASLCTRRAPRPTACGSASAASWGGSTAAAAAAARLPSTRRGCERASPSAARWRC
jgi:hypothetical protein